MHVIMLILLE